MSDKEENACDQNQNVERRGPRNLQEVLHLAVRNMEPSEDGGSATASSQLQGPDSLERRQFLEQALGSMSVNVHEIMKAAIKVLSEPNNENDESWAQKENALEILNDLLDNMDYANDFHKIGGFVVLRPGLRSQSSGIRHRTAEVIAELVQNNPYCQKAVTEAELIGDLVKLVDSDEVDIVRIKSLYALSGLLRDNPEGQSKFVALDGFSVLLRAMQSDVEKLKVKSSVLLQTLCSQRPSFKETLCNMGFVEQLVSLIQREHDLTHEHIVGALHSLVIDYNPGIKECQRSELNLKETLMNRIEFLNGKDQFLEEMELCKNLIDICFPDSDQQQEDR